MKLNLGLRHVLLIHLVAFVFISKVVLLIKKYYNNIMNINKKGTNIYAIILCDNISAAEEMASITYFP